MKSFIYYLITPENEPYYDMPYPEDAGGNPLNHPEFIFDIDPHNDYIISGDYKFVDFNRKLKELLNMDLSSLDVDDIQRIYQAIKVYAIVADNLVSYNMESKMRIIFD